MVCDDTNHVKKQQSAALSYFVRLYAVDERGHRVSDWGGSAPEGWGEIAYVELRNPEGDYSRKHDRQARSWKEGITWWEGLAGTPKNWKTANRQNLLFIYIGEYGVQGFFGCYKLRLGLVLEPRCLSLGILPGVGFDLFHSVG